MFVLVRNLNCFGTKDCSIPKKNYNHIKVRPDWMTYSDKIDRVLSPLLILFKRKILGNVVYLDLL